MVDQVEPLDRNEIEALKAIVAAATQGKWRGSAQRLYPHRGQVSMLGQLIADTVWTADATYIATFDPTLTARLIAAYEAAMDERDAYAGGIAETVNQGHDLIMAEQDKRKAAEAEAARLRAQVEADGHDAAYWRQALRDYVVEVRHPLPMILHCPRCYIQHIDVDDESGLWATERHHRKHLCKPEDGGCGYIWQPTTVYTVGVAALNAVTT